MRTIVTNGKKGENMHFDVDISAIEGTLRQASAAAAAVTLPLFRVGTSVENKETDNFDPVTKADRNAELAIRDVISAQFPDHSIIGEEHATKSGESAFSWIIDPIDGTRAFITGLPVWGTLIGVAHHGNLFAGLMSQPFIGETFIGLPGQSIYERQGKTETIKAGTATRLDQARLYTTTPKLFQGTQRDKFDALEARVLLPRYGSDCYAYCLLAAGHVDLVVEPRLNIYDVAALVPIIREAGGMVTTFNGDAPDQGGDIIAAATPELHAAAMDIMRD